MTVGYVYGIVRANLASTFSHFIFDAALIGLYASQFIGKPKESTDAQPGVTEYVDVHPHRLAVVDAPHAVSAAAGFLVGLRGNMFFLPAVFLGARLRERRFAPTGVWPGGLEPDCSRFRRGRVLQGYRALLSVRSHDRDHVQQFGFRRSKSHSFHVPKRAHLCGRHGVYGSDSVRRLVAQHRRALAENVTA